MIPADERVALSIELQLATAARWDIASPAHKTANRVQRLVALDQRIDELKERLKV